MAHRMNWKTGERDFFKKIGAIYQSQSKATRYGIVALFLILIAAPIFNEPFNEVSKNQAAPLTASSKTATITVNPSSGTFAQGNPTTNTFTVTVGIAGGGSTFNAVQATITLSNLTVVSGSITPGSCNFNWIIQPSETDPSFVGAILGSNATACSAYTMTVYATNPGPARVTLSNGAVVEDTTHTDILSSMLSGNYTIGSISPSPTGGGGLAPTFDPNIPLQIYNSSVTLSGTKDPSITTVSLNNDPTNISYPTNSQWQSNTPVALTIGNNIFTIVGTTGGNTQTPSTTLTINRHKLGDITGDGKINIFDLGALSKDWLKICTTPLSNPLSDLTGDCKVNVFDLGTLSKNWLQ